MHYTYNIEESISVVNSKSPVLPCQEYQITRLAGSLAAWTPSETAWVEPYIAAEYPHIAGGKKISVKVASVERTFWEKATILHHEAHRPQDSKIPARYARHYYDIYRIANSPYKNTALAQLELLEKVATFKAKFYPGKWAKYEEATKTWESALSLKILWKQSALWN